MFERPAFESGHLKFGEHPPTRGAIAKLLRTLREGKVIKTLRKGSGRSGAIYCLPDLINLCEGKQVA